MADFEVQMGIKIKLFGEDIIGAIGFQKLENGKKERNTILVKNLVDPQNKKITVGTMVKSIQESIEKITKVKPKEEEIKIELLEEKTASPKEGVPEGQKQEEEQTLKKFLDAVEVNLNEVYLKFVQERNLKEGKPPQFDEWKKIENDYAFSLELKVKPDQIDELEKSIPIFQLIRPDSLFVRFWNTKNKTVLEEMNIFDFEALTQTT